MALNSPSDAGHESELAEMLTNLISLPLGGDGFTLQYGNESGNHVNLLVTGRNNLAKSFVNFSSDQISDLERTILDSHHGYVGSISDLGGLLHFSEGSFRQNSFPAFHAYFKSCKFEISKVSKNATGLMGALRHCRNFVGSEVVVELVTEKLQSTSDKEIYSPTESRHTDSGKSISAGTSDLFSLHVQQRDLFGSYSIIRKWDGMTIELHRPDRNPDHATAIWHPQMDKKSKPGNWYKLPYPPGSSYFYLFGFHDANASTLFEAERKRLEQLNGRSYHLPLSVEEKFQLPTAQFLKVAVIYGTARRYLKVSFGCPMKRFYQRGTDGTLHVEVKHPDIEDQVILQSVTCPSVSFKNLNIQDNSGNKSFQHDVQMTKKLLLEYPPNLPRSADKNLLFHPFLPIVGFLPQKEPLPPTITFCRNILDRLQNFLLTIDLKNDQDGCEIVMFLHALRNPDSEPLTFGSSILTDTTHTSNNIPGNLSGEWNNVVTYCWLKPSTYVTNEIVVDNIDVQEWFNNFSEEGESYKVLSC